MFDRAITQIESEEEEMSENYCLSCGGHSHQSIHCPNVIPTTQCPCHPLPEPTYTQSQLDQALATQHAELAEKVRGLDMPLDVDYGKTLLLKSEVLAEIEGVSG
jgi:hypothetical protein